MRWVILGALALAACGGGSFEAEQKTDSMGGESGEPSTGGDAGETTTGGSGGRGGSSTGGRATGGTEPEGGEPSTGGRETGGSGGAEPTGGTDQGGSAGCEKTTFYLDEDGDGYGVDSDTVEACEAPDGYAAASGDCIDSDEEFNPGVGFDVPLRCTGFSYDCSEQISCPLGCEASGSRYYCSEPLDWESARQKCADGDRSIASAPLSSLNEEISEGMGEFGVPDYWLGARRDRDGMSNTWAWENGGTVDALAWPPGEPVSEEPWDMDCMMATAGEWHAVTCDQVYPFACE